ncbi:AI-2E family transporter [Dissulfurirhabdus thermomarina]|uniref:AI-2E family transporter n=1 Tax=Dissulfurirhabdus thermomarina TaxID=1765737 RepID=A0A6N9TTL6_DISTH|nr:AI-2E family transporter [Dissulfurirhabdus thermomarina]NDY42777.1 AI-2E family transporter [Dissulfurirhabdus thermomarina]NMX22627.1 AI-2E family transporter [Dissulfurirhabdus thermomarina]
MSDSRRWFFLAVGLGAAWLAHLLAPVLTPFLVSALLAYLGDPAVDAMERRRVPRTLAVALVFAVIVLAFLALVLVLVPLLERQAAALARRLPAVLAWARETALPWLAHRLGLPAALPDAGAIQEALAAHWRQAGGLAVRVLSSVSRSGMALLAAIGNLVLIPVVTFYLLRDWDRLLADLHALLPRRAAPTVAALAREADEVLGAFLKGQLLVMLALAAVYSIGLHLAGLELALLIGITAGLVSFVPYLGFALGILAAGAAALVQYHDLAHLLYVTGVFAVGQLLEGTVLTPVLVGDRVGLHPVVVIFAVLAGGQLFGFFGVLVAIPAAAVLMVLVRHARRSYLESPLYHE